MRRLGVLTGGGDAPGLNAAIRAVVRTAQSVYDFQTIGIRHGFEGLLEPSGTVDLSLEDVRGILPLGGTILGAANRGNPFARRVVKDGQEVIEDVSGMVVERINELELEALIVIGGDGTLRISQELWQMDCPVIGVPKTIDNDIGGTDFTFGFDTAVSIATEALDRLHTTAEAHHRIMILELMGRHAGFITLHAGLAGGADVILLPEIAFGFASIEAKIEARVARGRRFSILAVAEGAFPEGGEKVYADLGDEITSSRLGGIGQVVGEALRRRSGLECRVTVLGHLQRGGAPTSFDRRLATRYGAAAARLAAHRTYGRMVAIRAEEVIDVGLEEALSVPKRVDTEGDAVLTARNLGISLGD